MRDLNRREQAIRTLRAPNELTAADRDQLQDIRIKRNEVMDAGQAAREVWGRSTSIILVALATLAMAISLVRADQLPVVSNGLLLGGVFTRLYGVGWIIATDTSIIRFLVMTVALVITLALGYVRFVRRKAIAPATVASKFGEAEGLAALERRVRELEQRMNDAATALGSKGNRSAGL
ncbi:MAG TPA: hypothetical protein VNI83_10250 [Vicinamibacterales bacterium]|nr:hypothetical protein [Vicinamibacterales bacterium]